MNKSMNQLNELIEITRDGQRFYQHAAEEVKDVELQHLFRDLAQAKTQIIQALSVKVAASHEQPSQGGTLTGRMRELYADTRSRIGDHDTPYVDQLEQTEAHILEASKTPCRTPSRMYGLCWLLSCPSCVPATSACASSNRPDTDSCKTPGWPGAALQIELDAAICHKSKPLILKDFYIFGRLARRLQQGYRNEVRHA